MDNLEPTFGSVYCDFVCAVQAGFIFTSEVTGIQPYSAFIEEANLSPKCTPGFYNMQLCKVKQQVSHSCYTCNTSIYLDYVDEIDFRSYVMVEKASVYVPGHPFIDNRVLSCESPVRQISRPTSFIPSWKTNLCILYQVCGVHGGSNGVRERSDRQHTHKTINALDYTHVYPSYSVIDSVFVGNLPTGSVHIQTLTVWYKRYGISCVEMSFKYSYRLARSYFQIRRKNLSATNRVDS